MSNDERVNKDESQAMPMGWAASKLGELGQYLNGRGFKKSEWGTTGRPIIRIQDLTGTSSNPNYFDGEVEERHVVRDGDFLISWAATLGAYIYRGPEGLVNQHIFKVDSYINQAFHYYAVTFAIGEMYRRTRGTGMVHIVKSDFDDTDIPLPPLEEQSRIVDRIEELFTDLDAGIAALERVKRNLSRYRAAVLHAAVTGRLTEEWRKEHGPPEEPASELLERILEERRKQWEKKTLAGYEAKGKKPPKNWEGRYTEPEPTSFEDRETLATNWQWATVEQLTRGDRDSAYGVLVPGPDVQDGIPMVRVGDIKGGAVDTQNLKRINPEIASKFKRTFLSGGELLMSLVGSIGRTAIAPAELKGANTARAVGVIPLSELVVAEYVEFWFRNPSRISEMTKKSHEVARKTLNLEDVRATLVALPPHQEQIKITELVSEKLSQIDAMEAEVNRGLSRANRLRQAILKAAFEGKLVSQDPNDEPASVLLERIREQAAKAPKTKRKTRKKSSRKAATT